MKRQCTDKRYEAMLHAYELGMLSEEESQQLEIHLLECESCFETVRQLEPAATLIREDAEVREALKSEAQAGKFPSTSGKRWLPTMIAAAAVLLLLILKPWKIEFAVDQQAVAAENRLAVLYFENLADLGDSLGLSKILPPLIIADLSESHYVQVIPEQRLHDILFRIDSTSTARITRENSTEIANQADARWMLTGNIVQIKPHIEATVELIEVGTGNSAMSRRISVPHKGTVFDLVDYITVAVKEGLVLPKGAMAETDRSVSEFTTHSKEAYRYYLEGQDFYYKFYYTEAADRFERAVELDSSFAMAYYYLAMVKSARFLDRAVALLDHASEKDAYMIRSLQASSKGDLNRAKEELLKYVERYPDDKTPFLRLGQYSHRQHLYEQAVGYLRRALGIDPSFEPAYNALAYAYDGMGELQQAIEAIDKYIELAPNEANPYDSKGGILYNHHRYEEAIASFRIALDKKPDFNNSRFFLAHSMLVLYRLDSAEYHYRILEQSESPSTRQLARYYLGQVYLRSGRLAEAISHYADTRDEAIADSVLPYPSHDFMISVIESELGHVETAKRHAVDAITISANRDSTDHQYGRAHFVRLLALNGESERAKSAVDSLKSYLTDHGLPLTDSHYAAGSIAEALGNPDEAIKHYRLAVDDTTGIAFAARYRMARLHLDLGQLDSARVNFEHVASDIAIWRDYWDILAIKTDFYLGEVYFRLGEYSLARVSFERFLSRWGYGDETIREIAEAQDYLEKIKSRL